MPDAITVLTNDHRTVDQLFARVEGKEHPDSDAVHQIIKELSVHDAVERQLLYPTVRLEVPGGGRWADRSEEEHKEVAQTLADIDGGKDGSREQLQNLEKLIGLVRQHVEEEEQEIFPQLRDHVSSETLDELGEEIETAKGMAPTRPHPKAPDEGLGTTIVGAMSAPLDRLKDKLQGR